MFRTPLFAALAVIAGIGAAGCGVKLAGGGTYAEGTVTAASTGCVAGMAQIGVNENFLSRLCGCAESSETFIAPPSTLTCTIAAGTVVFWHFSSLNSRHLIEPVGTPTFPASPESRPEDDREIRVYTYRFDVPGTYRWRDLYNNEMNGTFVVQ